jgi:hypothetical protein
MGRMRVGDDRAGRDFCIFVLLSSFFSILVEPALAQGIDASPPEMFRQELHGQNEANRSRNPYQRNGVDGSSNLNQHLSSTGKPCLALEPYATAHLTNKKIYEHWITASNSCGHNIKVQVCYHESDDCILMEVPPYETKNAVLGIQPSMKEFQYDAKEK